MKTFWGVTVLSLLTVTPLLAQQAQEPRQQTQTQRQPGGQPSPQATMQRVDDRLLAAWLIIENHGEVQLAQLAQREAQNEEVKQFAQEMIKDHQGFIQKLQRFAPELNLQTQPGQQQTAQEGQQRQLAQGQQEGTPRTALRPPTGGQVSVIDLKQDLAQQQLQTVTEALRQQKEEQFDRAFIRHQIGQHMLMLDTLKVFRNHASPELAQVIQEGTQSTQQHLDHAQQLLRDLRQGGTQPQNQNPTRTPQNRTPSP